MINSIIQKMKRSVVTLRFSILAIFISLFVITTLLLISFSYVHTANIASEVSVKLAEETATEAQDALYETFNLINNQNQFGAKLISEGLIDPNNELDLLIYTSSVVKNSPIIQSAYWGDEQGNFVFSQIKPDGSVNSEIINRRNLPPVRTLISRDSSGQLIKTIADDASFDPRTRPWYVGAKTLGKTTWTDIYLYQTDNVLGMTIATPVFNKNGKLESVLGLDLRLDYLSRFLAGEMKAIHGFAFIVTRKGEVVAFPFQKDFDPKNYHLQKLPNIRESLSPWVKKSFAIFEKTKQLNFRFEHNGVPYLAIYKPLQNLPRTDWLIGIVIPEDVFIGEIKRTNLINAGISLLALLFGIFLVSALVTRIVKPLKILVNETKRIKDFDLSGNVTVRSRIREVLHLSNAINAMKLGLRSFQKYVPAGLIRELIKTGEAHLSGRRKPLTVFFSDIQDFTTITEKMSPNQLMRYLYNYLDELSHILVEERATIDKYIGDAIMAFWGAPHKERHACTHAARAALKCVARLEYLNKKWISQGKYPLLTRFGIHTGDAIVGNLGSSERLNYTAIGDTVNMANRLENINKIYGTTIMVSKAVYDVIHQQFILRFVDHVAVRGKSKSHLVYELLAVKASDLSFDINTYQQIFNDAFTAYQAQRWDAAITLFNKAIQVYPADTVALVFIKRCESFKLQPSPTNWDGVWRIN